MRAALLALAGILVASAACAAPAPGGIRMSTGRLAAALPAAAGRTFVGLSEDLAAADFSGCTSGDYAVAPATGGFVTTWPTTWCGPEPTTACWS